MEAQKTSYNYVVKQPFLNRLFAIFFVILILTYLRGVANGGTSTPIRLLTDALGSRLHAIILFCSTVLIGLPIIVIGLFAEIWKPSLDFTLNKDKTWRLMSIILFIVFVLINVCWWIIYSGDFLGQGWQKTIAAFFVGGSFTVDTSFLSLMFGILFLTRSTPKNSQSYKIVLFGGVCYEILMFMGTPAYLATGAPGIFQPWFWLDLTSMIVIFIGALRLLKMNVKNLILIIFILLGLFLLHGSIAFKILDKAAGPF